MARVLYNLSSSFFFFIYLSSSLTSPLAFTYFISLSHLYETTKKKKRKLVKGRRTRGHACLYMYIRACTCFVIVTESRCAITMELNSIYMYNSPSCTARSDRKNSTESKQRTTGAIGSRNIRSLRVTSSGNLNGPRFPNETDCLRKTKKKKKGK